MDPKQASSQLKKPLRMEQYVVPKRLTALKNDEENKHCDIEEIQRTPSPASFRRENSTRSLKMGYGYGSDTGSHMSTKPFSDAASVRSWASVGMGSTDGKKMIVRRVPTSPVELFNIVNPPT
ncbi:hypothetical protein Zmor_026614 [Zophobas morio]|uniref:Uncharacterized protein n=2 Tax=Zophobas morio TaxID=2755281 RepID=A0AA38HZK6_9CUCU|nr:hypothetical protein Zmor_026614 [Zophobas morio]